MNSIFIRLSEDQRKGSPDVAIARKKSSGKRAFTLVEILVSVTILSLMMLFLFSVFNLASQAWQNSEKRVDAFREARAALYIIRRDLSGLQVDKGLPLALNENLVPNLATLSVPTDQLFLVAGLNPDAQGGTASAELCAVGYYVGWGTNSFQSAANNFAGQSFNLFRYFNNSDTNFANLTNFWVNYPAVTGLQNLYKDPSTQPVSGDEVLARNVIGFRVKPYYWHDVVTVVAGVTNTNTVLASTNTGSTPVSGVFTERPAFLDISLTVVNYATAGQLGNNMSRWNDQIAGTDPKSIVNQNKQEFYMRVPFSP